MELGTLIAIGITQLIGFVVWIIRMNNKVTVLETKLQSQQDQFAEYKLEQHSAMREIKDMFSKLQDNISTNFEKMRTEIHEIDKRK